MEKKNSLIYKVFRILISYSHFKFSKKFSMMQTLRLSIIILALTLSKLHPHDSKKRIL